MCEAIQTLNERAANQERIETLKKSLKKLMGVTGWSIEKSMDALDVSEDDREELKSIL